MADVSNKSQPTVPIPKEMIESNDLTPLPSHLNCDTQPPYHPRQNKRSIILVFCCFFFTQIFVNYDSGAIPSVLDTIGKDFHLSEAMLGLLGALPYIGLIIGCPFLGRYLQTKSQKRVLVITMLLNIASVGLLAASFHSSILFISRFLIGLTQCGFCIYTPVWVDEFAPESSLILWMGLIQGGTVFGVLLGYLLTGYIKPWRYSILLQGLILLCFWIGFVFTPRMYINLYMPTKKEIKDEILKETEVLPQSVPDASNDEVILKLSQLPSLTTHTEIPFRSSMSSNETERIHKVSQINSKPSIRSLATLQRLQSDRYLRASPSGSIELSNSIIMSSSIDDRSLHPGPSIVVTDETLPNPSPVPSIGVTFHNPPFDKESSHHSFTKKLTLQQPIHYGTAHTGTTMTGSGSRHGSLFTRAPTLMVPSPAGAVLETLEVAARYDSPLILKTTSAKDISRTLSGAQRPSFQTILGPPIQLSTWASIKLLLRSSIYMWTVGTLCALLFVVSGIQFWSTQYFIQDKKISPGYVRMVFSIVTASGPTIGVFAGSIIVDRIGGYRSTRGLYRTLWFCFISGCLASTSGIIASFLEEFVAIISLMWFLLFFGGAVLPPATGILIASVDPSVRAFASGFSMFAYNIFGYALGTFLPGPVISAFSFQTGMRLIFFWSLFGVFGMGMALFSAWKDKVVTEVLASIPDETIELTAN